MFFAWWYKVFLKYGELAVLAIVAIDGVILGLID